MQVTHTCWRAGRRCHLLGGVAHEQVYWVTDHLIQPEEWSRILAIKQAEQRAKRQERGLHIGPPNRFNSVPLEPHQQKVQLNMSQSINSVKTDLNHSQPSSRPSSQPLSRPPSQPSAQSTSRPASRASSRTPSTLPTKQCTQSGSQSLLDNNNRNLQDEDTQPFHSSLDEDYTEVARRLEEATTTEDFAHMGEVNISVTEMHSFGGSEVSITLHWDTRDYPSITGKVQHVQNSEICLAPATIEGQKVQETDCC